MRQYKAIFLDWDDTIGDWTTAEHLALQDIYTHFQLDTLYPAFQDYLDAYKPYNLQLWGMYGRGEITKDFLHLQRFLRPLLKDAEPDYCPSEQLTQLAMQIGSEFLRLTNVHFCLMPDAERVVRYLASKYPLTIVSNGFREVQYYKFAHSGLQDCLTHTLVSDEIGINKPQSEIFQIALQRNGILPQEAIMIGDNYSSDIQGAINAGIDQIWITDLLPAEIDKEGKNATYIIPRLSDVMNIL